jgi:Zn-dependent protease with chaperone function
MLSKDEDIIRHGDGALGARIMYPKQLQRALKAIDRRNAGRGFEQLTRDVTAFEKALGECASIPEVAALLDREA